MHKFLPIFLVLLLTACGILNSHPAQAANLTPTNLRCDSRENPLGVEEAKPRLSWQLESSKRGQRQSAYQVLVTAEANGKNTTIWDSGKISTDQSIQVPYAGQPLQAARHYTWRVKVWDQAGKASDWSKPATWQMGLLSKADWGAAQWIALAELPATQRVAPGVNDTKGMEPIPGQPTSSPLPQFRKEIQVSKPLKHATAFISGLGHYEMSLNGQPVKDHFLDPGWTNYAKYSLYATYDITKELKSGPNVLGVQLGNGFYNIPRERYRKLVAAYGNPKVICRLQLEYTDGTTQEVVTDQSWKVTQSPITFSSIYGGEDWDATKEIAGWQVAGFNDAGWQTPVVVQGPPALLSQTAPPVKIMQTFSVVKVTQPKPGVWVYDLGQNASAIPQISVKGAAGRVVKITPGEFLNDQGLADQTNSGDPHYYQYTLKGQGTETWRPHFTYYGFRYLQIEGAAPADAPVANLPTLTQVQSLHVRNSMAQAGTFKCSNDLFNRTNTLIDWAIRSNVVSVMTDCPHREKLGWLEETHLMGSSVRYEYDIANLCRKLVHDMAAAQTPAGLVPDISPEFTEFGGGFRDSPEWGSAGVLMPWYAYQWYGDLQTLTEHYPMMKQYVAFLGTQAKDNILTHGLGDWYDLGPKHPGPSQLTPRGVTATALYHLDLTVLEKTARQLGKTQEADTYQQQAAQVRQAFNDKYFDKTKMQYATGSQTANSLPLYTGIVAPENKAAVLANLLKDLKDTQYRLTAGDIGYRYLLRVLENEGASEAIYLMNNRSDVPGYGYQLAKGATSLTESWQALRTASHNHFMLGHLMEWFYSGVGGIRQDEKSPAFKAIIIRPEAVGDLTSAQTSYASPYGPIRTDWMKQNGRFTLQVDIPANTTATVYLPTATANTITEGGKALSTQRDIRVVGTENGRTALAVGSGRYQFECR
ncbi:family 78 glycoside hydrolase catalytic domain [Hymenobacter sp.]|jgi:hypothetical protein|uniref:family 78 glycoside hydrolase catalytic domain n=1 Tax=Hymenobacter sp. TaxID=1898978 RepID=UPI002EDABEBC